MDFWNRLFRRRAHVQPKTSERTRVFCNHPSDEECPSSCPRLELSQHQLDGVVQWGIPEELIVPHAHGDTFSQMWFRSDKIGSTNLEFYTDASPFCILNGDDPNRGSARETIIREPTYVIVVTKFKADVDQEHVSISAVHLWPGVSGNELLEVCGQITKDDPLIPCSTIYFPTPQRLS